MRRSLSLKERRFVDAYLGSCAGNGTQAAIAAGYSRRSARRMATRLSTKAHIRAALDTRLTAERGESIATAEERDTILSSIMRNKLEGSGDRTKAIHELNKVTGRHTIHVDLTGFDPLKYLARPDDAPK